MRGMSGFMGLVALFVLGSVALAASPLDGTQWQIKLTNAAAKTPSEDRIRFEKGRFTSPLFQPKGFPTSNYTLTEEKGGPVIWETMQTSQAEGTLSWRGELGGQTMRGIASWRKPDGTVVNYNFAGSKLVEPSAAKPEPTAPKAEPAAPKPKPKKPEPKAKSPTRSP
jgi:hypothetical protein